MSKKNSDTKSERVRVVTKEMREAMKAKGIDNDAIPNEGIHRYRRVSPDKVLKKRSDAKIKISMFLDADILDYFQAHAESKNDLSYQKQINDALRAAIERDKNDSPYSALLKDEQFIGTLCKILEPRLNKRRRAA
jgi:uncharacterized protein (DUF4415 family)